MSLCAATATRDEKRSSTRCILKNSPAEGRIALCVIQTDSVLQWEGNLRQICLFTPGKERETSVMMMSQWEEWES